MGSRIAATTLALLAIGAATATAATSPGATATLSSALPGARNVAVTIHFRSLLRCGLVPAASLQVRLPREMRVPKTIARTAVRVAGSEPATVRVAGTVVTLGLPRSGISCMTMRLGTVAIQFARTAGLRNPTAGGSYDFTVVAGLRVWLGRLVVR